MDGFWYALILVFLVRVLPVLLFCAALVALIRWLWKKGNK